MIYVDIYHMKHRGIFQTHDYLRYLVVKIVSVQLGGVNLSLFNIKL